MTTIAVTSPAELVALHTRVWKRRSRRSVRVSLQLTGMSETAREAHERTLNRLLTSCGCGEGAMGALALTALVLVHFVMSSDWSLTAGVSLAILLVGALALGGAGGKLAGLALARLRLRWRCRRILHELNRSTAHDLRLCRP